MSLIVFAKHDINLYSLLKKISKGRLKIKHISIGCKILSGRQVTRNSLPVFELYCTWLYLTGNTADDN